MDRILHFCDYSLLRWIRLGISEGASDTENILTDRIPPYFLAPVSGCNLSSQSTSSKENRTIENKPTMPCTQLPTASHSVLVASLRTECAASGRE